MKKYWAFLLVVFLGLSGWFFAFWEKNVESTSCSLMEQIYAHMHAYIDHNGYIEKPHDLHYVLDVLKRENVYMEKGKDDLRIKFIHLQGVVEYALSVGQACGNMQHLVGMIHAPTPTSSLCTAFDQVDRGLLAPSIRSDSQKYFTVKSRAHTVRQYLHKGGELYVVYSKDGLQRRTEKQQKVYLNELASFSGNLCDCPLSTSRISDEMIGALYLFENKDGKRFAFSIKSKQPNDPRELSEWGIWLGPIDSQIVHDRVSAVMEYFVSKGGPDLRGKLCVR